MLNKDIRILKFKFSQHASDGCVSSAKACMDGFQVQSKCLEFPSIPSACICLHVQKLIILFLGPPFGKFLNFEFDRSRILNAMIFNVPMEFLPHFTTREAAAGANCDLSTTVQPGMLTNAGDLTMDMQMLMLSQKEHRASLGSLSLLAFEWTIYTYLQLIDWVYVHMYVCSMACGFLWMGWGGLSADAGMKCFVVVMAIFFESERLVSEILDPIKILLMEEILHHLGYIKPCK